MRATSLERQLKEVNDLLRAMCDRVFAGMQVIQRHVSSGDKSELLRVVLLDNEVDEIERTIDEKILYIFATQQPLGFELRQAYASAKVAHQIERVGDAVESLARQLSSGSPLMFDKDKLIQQMVTQSSKLFDLSYRAMFAGEFDPVVDIYRHDDEIDELHKKLLQNSKLLLGFEQNSSEVETALQMISIGNKLEKIADLCCNWAEQVDFMLHGMQRMRIGKPPSKIVVIDKHNGVLAGLVATTLTSAYPIQAEVVVATDLTFSELNEEDKQKPFTSLGAWGTKVAKEAGLALDVFPVAQANQLSWNHVLLTVQIEQKQLRPNSSSNGISQLKSAMQKSNSKAVTLNWESFEVSDADLKALCENDLDSSACSESSHERLVEQLTLLRRESENLRALLRRI